MKKVLSLLLSVAMLLSITAGFDFSAYADDVYTDGDFQFIILEKGFYYDKTFHYDGKAEIIGYTGSETDITIPLRVSLNYQTYAVTSISNRAFAECENLTSVTIPESVTNIGDYSFYNCVNLTSVTIPESVTNIGDYSFFGCENLTNVTIPAASIGDSAFMSCHSLADVTILEGVESIGSLAFFDCLSLTEIILPVSVVSIAEFAFAHCENLTGIYIANRECNIADDINTIADTATIYGYANSTAQEYAQKYDRTFSEIDDAVYGFEYRKLDDETAEITDYTGFASDLIIPSNIDGYTVTGIGDFAFENCVYLTSVTIPDSVTYMGKVPFVDCYNLKNIYVEANNQNYTSQHGVLFNKTATELKEYPMGKEKTSYSIPYGVTNIGAGAFYDCIGLKYIDIPYGVTTIGEDAFAYCENLVNVTIPESVTAIGGGAFEYCVNLISVTIPLSVTTIEDFTFYNCDYLTNIFIPSGVTTIGDWAFADCDLLTGVTIQENVTAIGNQAFYVRSNLSNIVIPASVTTIGNQAFCWCINLSNIVISEGVTTIGEEAFSCCGMLTSVTIPASVTTIGNRAFDGYIESIYIMNKNCDIYDDISTIADMATIYGYKGSTAQKYAEKYGRNFIPIGKYITVLTSELGSVEINGELVSGECVVEYGKTYTLKAIPKDSAEFVGWFVDGKMISSESVCTLPIYSYTAIMPVFSEKKSETFTVVFMDMYGNCIAILNNEAIKNLQKMPDPPSYAGLVFNAWSKTLEEIKALKNSAIVYAYYRADENKAYTVTAEGCKITVDGEQFENSAAAHYNSQVTVESADGAFASWSVNGTVAAYGESYSFLCGSDVVIELSTAVENPTPVVVSVSKTETNGDFRVKFLATRFVPKDYSLVESGFVYGKGMEEDDLTLTNVGTEQGTEGGKVKIIKNSNTAPEGQFALTYGVEKMNAQACARPYMIVEDSKGESTLIYGEMLTSSYPF